VNGYFEPLSRPANLPNIRFHDLLHTCSSLLVVKGVDPKLVQERPGHSTVSRVMDTYSDIMPGVRDEAAAATDDIFS